MTTFAVSMVRDEADVVEKTVGWMASQVDHVIVADNGSTDDTRAILTGLGVEVLDDPKVGYYQSEKMSRLTQRAAAHGAKWVVPFDADEVWMCDGRIADRLAELPDEALVCEAAVFDHVATGDDAGIPWRRAAQLPLRKTAVRALPGVVIHQGNHGATFPGRRHPLTVTGLLEVRHFPYRSAEQMIRKARNGAEAYAATDLPEDVGKHWRDYGRLTDNQIAEVFYEYFYSADPAADGLIYDPVPELARAVR